MPLACSLSAADLAALLSSRICHDLISPVGAINNALELYDEAGAEADALDLIRMSAVNASARLQFARIAFGASGAAGSRLDTNDAVQIAQKYMANEKAELIWEGEHLLLPKNEIKLLLNLLLVANASLPRGGTIHLTTRREGEKSTFHLVCNGKMLRVPPKFAEYHSGQTPAEPVDAHSIQAYYTLLLADMAHMPVHMTATETDITFTAG